MVGQGVQEVAHLFEVMMWGEQEPLAEAVGRGELKKCDGALVGQEVLELLVMGSLGFLKLYSTTQSLPPLICLRCVNVSIDS
jgi:hypothetical protein